MHNIIIFITFLYKNEIIPGKYQKRTIYCIEDMNIKPWYYTICIIKHKSKDAVKYDFGFKFL